MKKLIYVILPIFMVAGMTNLAYSGMYGGPNPTGGCNYVYFNVLGGGVPSQGGMPKNQGTTLLGQFIATQEAPGSNVLIQIQIAKGNAWYTYEFIAKSQTSLCDPVLTDTVLLDAYYLWPCEFDIASEIMDAPASGYDGYLAMAVSLFTKGSDCTTGQFVPETCGDPLDLESCQLDGYVSGAVSKLTRWGDIKLKFIPYKLPLP